MNCLAFFLCCRVFIQKVYSKYLVLGVDDITTESLDGWWFLKLCSIWKGICSQEETCFFFRICEWYDYTTTMAHRSEILWLHRLIYETWWKNEGDSESYGIHQQKPPPFWRDSKAALFLGVSKRLDTKPAGLQGFGSAPKRLETRKAVAGNVGTDLTQDVPLVVEGML